MNNTKETTETTFELGLFEIEYLKDEVFINDRLRAYYYLHDNNKFQKMEAFYNGMLHVIDVLGLVDEVGLPHNKDIR